jgi:hypothetical protein
MRNENQLRKHAEVQRRWSKNHPEYDKNYRQSHRKHIQKAWRYRMATPENKLKWLFSCAKSRSKKRGITFNITVKDLPPIPECCPVFPWIKLSLYFGGGHRENVPSIDRINNKKGYVKGNVRIISLRANRLKSNATLQELKALLKDRKRA